MPPRASTSAVRWPFWLLIAAWFCANVPSGAAYVVLTWLAEARHFSHQSHLTERVAHVLVGEKSPDHFAMHPSSEEPRRPMPALPQETAMKKIELAMESSSEVQRPRICRIDYEVGLKQEAAMRRAQPPHGPPRAANS